MVRTCKENARKQTATKKFRMGTRRNTKKGKTQREINGVRRSMKNYGLTEEDTRDRDRWRNIVLVEGKPLYSGRTLDDDDDDDL
jgi:hypothetical protein